MVKWDQILLKKGYHPEDPDQIVVNLAFILEKRGAERVLDLGCGAGRHLMCLAEKGFETHGADISERGLGLSKKRLKSRELEAEIIKCDMKALPYISSSFDAVICVQTIYHQKLRDIRETISEIYRILKRKGLLLANFHSRRSSKCGRGIEVEDGTFRQEGGPERGILHHFFNETELRELLRDFEVSLEAKEERIGDYLRSSFIVLAERI